MIKHTPGPWQVSGLAVIGTRDVRVNFGSGDEIKKESICRVTAKSDAGEDRANANLIAAAPEMLETLKLVTDNCGNPNCSTCKAVRATIAKAEGRAA